MGPKKFTNSKKGGQGIISQEAFPELGAAFEPSQKDSASEPKGPKKDQQMIGDFRAMAAQGRSEDEPREPRKEYKKPVFTGKAKLKADDKPAEEVQNSKQNYDFGGM